MGRAVVPLLMMCILSVCMAAGESESSPSPTFINRYREFDLGRVQRLRGIQNQADLDNFLKWQGEQIDVLLRAASPEERQSVEEFTPLGNLFQLSGDHARAIHYFQKSLEALPGESEALSGLLVSLLETNQVQEADRLFTLQADTLPKNRYFQIGLRLAQALTEIGEYEKSDQLLRAVQAAGPPDEVQSLLVEFQAENLAASGRKDKAVAMLEAQLNQASGHQPVTRNLQDKLQQITLLHETAPAIAFEKWIGSAFPQESWNGKVVLLDFWAPWCAPCRAGMSKLKKLYEQFHSQGLEILGVTTFYGNFSDGSRQVPNVPRDREFVLIGEYWQGQGLPWSTGITADQAAYKAYHVNGIPQAVLIDPKGIIRYIEVGFNPYSGRLEQRIRNLLKK